MKNSAETVTIPASEYESLQAQNESLQARQSELEALVKYYEGLLRLNKHRQFGSSSETAEALTQLSLFDEVENTAEPKQAEPELEEVTYQRRKRKGKREADLSALPTEVVEHDLPEDERICPDCGGELHRMGQDSRRELKIIPARGAPASRI